MAEKWIWFDEALERMRVAGIPNGPALKALSQAINEEEIRTRTPNSFFPIRYRLSGGHNPGFSLEVAPDDFEYWMRHSMGAGKNEPKGELLQSAPIPSLLQAAAKSHQPGKPNRVAARDVSDAELRRWWQPRAAECMDRKRAFSEKADYEAAKVHFQPKHVARKRITALRHKTMPDLITPGPRGKLKRS